MLVLALDTTTRQGSLALARDRALVGSHCGDAAITHGERLPGDLIRLLDAHALRLGDVDLFAVAAGPGSFTGLRIGIATMQGLALAHSRPLIGVSALDALNEAVRSLSPQPSALRPRPSALSPESEVCVWMDAQRGQVFSAVYGGRGEAAIVDKPADILSRWRVEGRVHPHTFVGDGAILYQEAIRRFFGSAEVLEQTPALAPSIARLAEEQLRLEGPSPPDAIRPIYVRRSDAELARDRARDAVPAARPAKS